MRSEDEGGNQLICATNVGLGFMDAQKLRLAHGGKIGPISVGPMEKANGMGYRANRSVLCSSAVFVLVDRLLRQDRH